MSNDGTGLREHVEVLQRMQSDLAILLADPTLGDDFNRLDLTEQHAALTAALSAVAPPPVLEGWLLVPRAVTNAMQIAGLTALDESDATPAGMGRMVGYKAVREAYAAMLAASPAAPAQPEGGEAVLPCDVIVAPATRIKAGCKLSTLLHCIDTRRGVDLADPFPGADYEALAKLARPAPAQQAVTDEMRLNWLLARCTVDWSGVSIPCGLSRAGDPAESRAAIDAALASNAAASAADAQEGVK